MFSRPHRLSRTDIETVVTQGSRKHTQHFSLRVFVRNNEELVRVAVGVSKKAVPLAATRIKIKRRMRACIQQYLSTIPAGSDMLITVKSDVSTLTSQEITSELKTLFGV